MFNKNNELVDRMLMAYTLLDLTSEQKITWMAKTNHNPLVFRLLANMEFEQINNAKIDNISMVQYVLSQKPSGNIWSKLVDKKINLFAPIQGGPMNGKPLYSLYFESPMFAGKLNERYQQFAKEFRSFMSGFGMYKNAIPDKELRVINQFMIELISCYNANDLESLKLNIKRFSTLSPNPATSQLVKGIGEDIKPLMAAHISEALVSQTTQLRSE